MSGVSDSSANTIGAFYLLGTTQSFAQGAE